MLSLRKLGAKNKRWPLVMVVAMFLSGIGPSFVPQVRAQTAPVGNGFTVDAGDLRFIYQQIQVAQANAAGQPLIGCGPFQVNSQAAPCGNPQLPMGLRYVDGSNNNLVDVPDQHLFGAADQTFHRLTTPVFRDADTFDPDGPGPAPATQTSYKQKSGVVADAAPRLISNLIVDQTAKNPAAVAAATNPCGQGGFVCQGTDAADPVSGALFIPNITPDFGLSAPFNLMFAFFGQFFDHGLDLVTKGGGTVIIPLQPDDPLFVAGSNTNFMVMTRGQNLPGPDGILGTADDIQEGTNTTTPWVDQNQTYTSHPSHQVFLRQYTRNAAGRTVPDGKVLDGSDCAPRGTGFAGDNICDIGNWNQVKAQAASLLGIQLVDQDVFDVPLILTDPYGHFKPGLHGYPQIVRAGNVLLEGDPAANGGKGVLVPADAFHTGHAFLNDIAHNAVPNPGLIPDADATTCNFRTCVQPPGTYDDELLGLHFITGDGRGNENIALTMVHQIFHAEHNRLTHYLDNQINTLLTPAEIAAWHSLDAGSGWDYGERLFQASRFVTEMEYQHLVFEEFGRKMQPLLNAFLGGITSINGNISAEFAHTVYRLGHSMLPEVVGRTNANGTTNDIRLFDAFLNPLAFNDGGPAGHLNAAQAAGSIIRGLTRQVGNELDEFVTQSVRETLVGLPLDLAAINIARGRSEGIPPLNEVRRQFFAATKDESLAPYANWFEFGLHLKHAESLDNFVAAYGTHPSIVAATTVAAKRTAAHTLVSTNDAFMFQPSTTSGLESVDFWVGGLAEKQTTFGGLLGTTFNFVFEHQLEDLQNGDRFYYLQRTDGLNMRFSLEGNSFAELARRNTDLGGTMHHIFEFADHVFDPSDLAVTGTTNFTDGTSLMTLFDGTKMFFDPRHRGENVLFNGGAGDDRMMGDVGDDTLNGNAGNDRMIGGDGNDSIIGGDGDDIIFGDNGDDILEGGPGNDALNSGPGFGGDIVIGGDGNDFMVGGDDGVEYFGGPGNDVIVDGAMRSEGIFGGPGDDWIYDGDGHDGGIFGDNGNVFDLLAGLDPIGGDDVLGGGPGQDNHWGEGGNDIFLMSEGTNKFFGDYGFDFVTQRGWPAPGDIELNHLPLPGVILNFNDLRNMYRFVDGASGWDFDDHIIGDENTADPAAPVELLLQPQMALTPEYAAKVAGLSTLMTNGFGKTLPWIGGNILLGGLGSDTIEGRGGDDLIDGDLWLNVQLRAVLNDGTVKLVDDPRLLIDDVFADPQRLNPGNITIVRSIVTPTNVPAPDCGDPTPLNCDVAVFSGNLADYSITRNANGSVTVFHVAGAGKFKSPANDGTDILRNMELLQFADTTVPVPGVRFKNTTVPNVVGLQQTAANAALDAAFLSANPIIGFSTTAPVGSVLLQSPVAGTRVPSGTTVDITVSAGTQVPNVVGMTQANATAAITAAGLVTTVTLQTNAAPAGTVVSQFPPAIGTNTGVVTTLAPGSTVNIVVSTGLNPAPVQVGQVIRNQNASAGSSNLVATLPAAAVPANSLLVALISVDAQAPPAPNTAVVGITNTGGAGGAALTWTRAVRANAQLGTAEIWWAFNTTARTTNTTITADLGNTPFAGSMVVRSFTGANPTLVGAASAAANAASGPPAGILTTTVGNSIVMGVGVDWDKPRVLTPGAGQTIINQFRPDVGDTYWAQTAGAIPNAGTVVAITDSYTVPMSDRWNMAVIEIRPKP